MNIQIAIKFDSNEIPTVAKMVHFLCVQNGIDDSSKLNQVELSVVELLTNIINYAVDIPAGGLIKLHCRFVESIFSIAVSDGSKKIAPEVAKEYTNEKVSMPTLDIGVDDLPESGWGIQLIKTACDDISYKRINDKNVYKLGFDFSLAIV